MVRTTVFHELGHAILDSKEHTCERCSDIMSASAPETFSIFAKEEEWQKALDKLFNQIKEKFKE